jgi:GAF domain-containing protein
MAAVLRSVQSDDWADDRAGIAARCAVLLGMDGLAVSLVAQGDLMELIWCFGESSRTLEDLQFALGEGPGPDAIRQGAMVLVSDLAASRPERWPTLSAEALGLPVRGVFCFPLAIGAIRVGVLTAVRHSPGPLTAHLIDDALVLAAAMTARLLSREGEGNPLDAPHVLHRAVVHQATGMISVQLAVPLSAALLRLRAYAFESGRSLIDVSGEVVARRLRLASDADNRTTDGDRDGTDPSGEKRDGSS